ncbi:MAG: DUF3618 domain-containing protein [Acidobacteriaceae bacterium]|nr:DUF3618 domain-containing protein [Acidobacteriaceae bacterium]
MGEATGEVRTGEAVSSSADTRVRSSPPPIRQETGVDSGADIAQIRAGIVHTRAEMSETIDALEEKLDPTRIKERVKDQIREKATEVYGAAKSKIREATIGKAEKIMANVSCTVSDATQRTGTAVRDTSTSLIGYIRENPVPLGLVGLGLGMLIWNSRKTQQYSYGAIYRNEPQPYGDLRTDEWNTSSTTFGDSAREAANTAAEKVRTAASTVADRARDVADRAGTAVTSATNTVRDAASSAADAAREQFNYVSEQTRQRAQVAKQQLNTTLQDNPMALGIAALAAGAILGLSLPATRIEGEYMGEARDQLIGRAKSAAREAVEKVQHVAEEAGRSVKDAAQREGLTMAAGSNG